MDTDPDYELDAYMHFDDARKILCDLRLWLPNLASEECRIEVVALGVDADQTHAEGLVRFSSVEPAEGVIPWFEAHEVLIRQSTYRGARLAGGTRLTIGHIGRIILRSQPLNKSVGPQLRNNVQFILSDVDYGIRLENSTVKYTGDRRVHKESPRILQMRDAAGIAKFDLERHWTWLKGAKDLISASSTPVLNLRNPLKVRTIPAARLVEIADDTCLFLSLAARHRVLVHAFLIQHGSHSQREWRNPLKRNRAAHEEHAEGVLVDPIEAEAFVTSASDFWFALAKNEKDAIRSAVFSVHPLDKNTLEARFVSMFFAFEGLAKIWGSGEGTLRAKVEKLMERYSVSHALLWPFFDSESLVGLASIRNHLAHGRVMAGAASGALAIANDHLQMWIEQILLAVIGFVPNNKSRDWLQSQLIGTRGEVLEHRSALWPVLKA